MTTTMPVLKVLHIEDNPVDAIYVKEILAEAGARWEMTHVRRLKEGLKLLGEQAFDGLLLDLDLIDSRGLETLDTVHRIYPSIPIVVLSGFQDETFGFRSLEKGTQDYLVKGQIDGAMLVRAMRYAIERKRTETALQESEARLKSMFLDASIGMAVVSLEGDLTQVNPAFCRFLGYTDNELLTKSIRDITYIEDWPGTADKLEQLLSDVGRFDRYEKRYKYKNGGIVWGETQAVLIRDGEGHPSHFLAQVVDVTARKLAEQALRQSEARFRTLTERASDLVLVVDAKGGIRYKSQNVEHVLGFPERMTAEERLTDLVHPDDREELARLFMEGVEQPGAIRKGEVRLRHRSGAWRMMEAVARNLLEDPVIQGVVMNLRDITERKEAELALKESEARFRVLVQRAPEAILVHDVDLDRFVDSNFNAERLFGCSAETLLRSGPGVFYTPDQPDGRPISESIKDHVRKALEGQEVVFERRILNAEEKELVCEVRVVRLPSSNRKLLRASYIDITDRKRAEESLRDSEERYRGLFDSSVDGIAYTDLSGTIIRANSSYADMLGYSRAEVVGKNYADFTPPRWQEYDRRAFTEELIPKGHCREYEKEYIRRDGAVFPVTVRAWLIRDRQGRPSGMWRIIRDITEQKKAEQDLKAREELMRFIVKHDPNAIAIFDRDMNYLAVSDRFLKDYNVKESDVLGKNHYVIFPEMPQRWKDIHQRCLAGAVEESENDQFVRPDGSITYNRWTCMPWICGGGEIGGIVMYTEVMTERKLAEQALKEAKERAERFAGELARSNRDLEEFARVVSHDLQEPLRMVTGFLQLLQTRYGDRLEDKGKEFIAYAVDGAARMKGLISALLDYSRVGGHKMALAPAPLDGALDEALVNLKSRIMKSGAVITRDPLPVATMDADQISRVFQNLIGNAIKFTREPTPRVHVGAEQRGAEWVVSVRDNGIGIDPKYSDRIFDVFQTLHPKEEFEGTGIGLAICKKIVQRHGGRIWVESEPGKGAAFFFSLPAGPASA